MVRGRVTEKVCVVHELCVVISGQEPGGGERCERSIGDGTTDGHEALMQQDEPVMNDELVAQVDSASLDDGFVLEATEDQETQGKSDLSRLSLALPR